MITKPQLPPKKGHIEVVDFNGKHVYQPTPEQLKKEQAEQENRMLKAKLKASTESQQFLEDCLAEMAQVVYA